MSDETMAETAEPELQRSTPAMKRKGGRPPGSKTVRGLVPPRPKMRTTAGTPAVPQATVDEVDLDLDDEFLDPETGRPLERKTSLANGGSGIDLDVPIHHKKRGWDYEYKTLRVIGQEVDSGELMAVAEGGWIPVRPGEMPGLMPHGHTGNTIDRYGMRLYRRPMKFTIQARKELLDKAETQKIERVRTAMQGSDNDNSHTQRHVNDSEIVVEAGVKKGQVA